MHRPGRPRDLGAAAVEFALVSVALFTLMFGVVQYGFYFLQASAVEAAAREGARRASVGIGSLEEVETDPCAEWGSSVLMGVPESTRGSIRSLTSTGATARGEDVTVTVVWEPVSFRLVPVPDPAPETAVTRVERLGAVTGGCHLDLDGS